MLTLVATAGTLVDSARDLAWFTGMTDRITIAANKAAASIHRVTSTTRDLISGTRLV